VKGLKILQIISRSDCDSGGGLQALELARGLRGKGHDVWFAAKAKGSAQRRCRDLNISFLPLSMKGNLDLASIRKLRGFVKREGIQVIHAHKGLAHSLALFSTVGMRPAPVLVANRGVGFSLSFWNKWKYLMPQTSGVVAVSESVRGVLKASGIPQKKIRVIYGGVDLERFSPRKKVGACKSLGLDPSLNYVAMVAQFRSWKGHHILAEAVSQLSGTYPSLAVLLAGKTRGKTYKAFKEKVDKMGLGGYFLFLGYRRDVELVIAASHLLVAPSLEGEGLPGVLREALASGRPVVASEVAGAGEVILHEETGLLVPPGDSFLLAQALARLLRNGGLRDSMGERGRALVERRFSHEHRALLMEAYYRELLEKA